MFRIEVKGVEQLLKKVKQFKKEFVEICLPKALAEAAEELLFDSKQYVPVLTGALKDSGQVSQVLGVKGKQQISVVYPLHYAERQHELEFKHPSLRQGRFAAKFLSTPATLNAGFYQELIAMRLIDELFRL